MNEELIEVEGPLQKVVKKTSSKGFWQQAWVWSVARRSFSPIQSIYKKRIILSRGKHAAEVKNVKAVCILLALSTKERFANHREKLQVVAW